MENFYNKCKERFLRYVKVCTESKANTGKTPSTECQFDLAKILYEELNEIGASDTYLDMDKCIVYGTIPSTRTDKGGKNIALVAHMDTAPDCSGLNVKPWVYENYQGGDIVLNKEKNIIMEASLFPNLKKYIGQDIVFTDGTTLLGGDDKAAISEIMTMAEYFINNPEIKHGPIKIAFTPDEEVGGLAKDLDLNRLNCEAGYTVDGDFVGYYSDETFNATEAQVTINGKNVHPGTAKGIMKNAIEIANEFLNMLPPERPQNTEGRDGFFHPHYIGGTVEKCEVFTILRDHDDELFDKKISTINHIAEYLNQKYGKNTVEVKWANGYRSMKKIVDKIPYLIPTLEKAIIESGVTPTHLAFRGGTDGSALSHRGLPSPNISAGYENGHSRFEYVPIQSMEKITEILVNLFIKLGELN